MEKLGYQVELKGKHGTFEIAGVPKAVLEAFSQRREAILEKAAELGITSPKGRDGVTTHTRDPKLNVEDREGLQRDWIEKAAALGFDGKDAPRMRPSGRSQERGAQQPARAGLSSGHRGGRKRARTARRGCSVRPIRWSTTGIASIAQSPAEARAQLAVASAVRMLSASERRRSTSIGSPRPRSISASKGVTIDHVEAPHRAARRARPAHPGRDRVTKTRWHRMVTTPEALRTEESILAVEAGQRAGNPDRRRHRGARSAAGRLADRELNPGQLAAATLIVSTEDRHVVVQGVAGAGKSTMLQAVARVAESEGKTVLGLAFQNKMVADMKEGAGIKAQTIASFISHNERHLTKPKTPTRRPGGTSLKDQCSSSTRPRWSRATTC